MLRLTSALPSNADIAERDRHVAFCPQKRTFARASGGKKNEAARTSVRAAWRHQIESKRDYVPFDFFFMPFFFGVAMRVLLAAPLPFVTVAHYK